VSVDAVRLISMKLCSELEFELHSELRWTMVESNSNQVDMKQDENEKR
jgi:hypothetical protein